MKQPYDFAQATFLLFSLRGKFGLRLTLYTSLIQVILGAILIAVCFPLIVEFTVSYSRLTGLETDPEAELQDVMEILWSLTKGLGVFFLLYIPLYLISCSAHAALYNDHLLGLRKEGFPLSFDGDMWRVAWARIVVGLAVLGIIILFYGIIVLAVILLVSAVESLGAPGIIIAGLFGFVGLVLALLGMAYVWVKVMAIPALCVRDKKLKIREAWQMSKGVFWWGLLSLIIISTISYVATNIIFYGSLGLGMVSGASWIGEIETLAEDDLSAALSELVRSPALIIGALIAGTAYTLVTVLAQLCSAGLGSYIVKRHLGAAEIADVFSDEPF